MRVLHFTDPGCPWAYSVWPALTALKWRYGDQLAWRTVLIGLTERREQYERRGYTPAGASLTRLRFARYGMPFGHVVKPRVAATSPACRAVVATRLEAPELEEHALRALQWLQFTTNSALDDLGAIAAALDGVPGLDGAALVDRLGAPDVREAYEADRALARRAAGTAAEAQGKAAATDGPVRFTAPSLVFEDGDRRLVAGGWQPLEAYDVCVANLRPDLARRPAPESPGEVLAAAPYPLATAEVAQVLCEANDASDVDAARAALLRMAAAGDAVPVPVGDDVLWAQAADGSAMRRSASATAAANGELSAASASS